MIKLFSAIVSLLVFTLVSFAQQNIPVKPGRLMDDLKLKKGEEQIFSFTLKKGTYYSVIAVQKGIDIVIALKDKSKKTIEEKDSPNGMFGPEKIIYSPDSAGTFYLSVKALDETYNANKGKYSLVINEIPKTLQPLSYKALTEDFDILKNAFIETRVGLWYHTYLQFDSMCSAQRNMLKDRMTAFDFYKVVAPIVAFTDEGHCNIRPSDEINAYVKQNGLYFPFLVKILEGKAYIISDLDNYKTKGLMISSINGLSIDTILEKFLLIEPADGYNITSKYHWIETAFSRYYLRFYKQTKFFDLILTDPSTGKQTAYNNIPALNTKAFNTVAQKAATLIPNYHFKEASSIKFDEATNTATLTVNTFALDQYKGGRKGFQDYLENTFKTISDKKIQHLIIDIRKHEGGEQGMEDHLLAYLIDKEYVKYKYVEIPGFAYSFLQYTDYKDHPEILEKELKEDFYRTPDGRFLNLKGHYEGEKPHANNFKGDIYILISGLTFSGGSEFAALAKNHTNAIFIGEETGGGYYGNSSGSFLKFTLPNTNLTGRIPLCKFAVQEKDTLTPFGHGIIPDHYVQPSIAEYLNGYDAEMEFTKKLIQEKSK